MTEQLRKYLNDILYSIELIEDFTKEISDFFAYEKDFKTKSAVERQLGIIGEAINQIQKKDESVAISSTRQMVDFRNRLIHSYDNIDDAIVWVILKKHIPRLKEEVMRIAEK